MKPSNATDPGPEPPTVTVKIEITVSFTSDTVDGPETDVEAQCEHLADEMAKIVHNHAARFGAPDVDVNDYRVLDWEVKP